MKLLAPIFLAVVLTLCGVQSQFTPQYIEFLINKNYGPGDGLRLTSSSSNVPAQVRDTVKVCIRGAWALYTRPNFGQNDYKNGSLQVYVVTGHYEGDCSDDPSVAQIFKTVYSVRALGQEGVELYPLKYFVAPAPGDILTKDDIPSLTSETFENPFLSVVFADTTFDYIVCGSEGTSNCICVTRVNSPLVVSNLANFPKSNPLKRLSRVQRVSKPAHITECKSLPQPEI